MNFSRQRKLLHEHPILFFIWFILLAYALYGSKTFFSSLGLIFQDPSQLSLYFTNPFSGDGGLGGGIVFLAIIIFFSSFLSFVSFFIILNIPRWYMIVLWILLGLNVLGAVQEIPSDIAYNGTIDWFTKLPILYQILQVLAYRSILKALPQKTS